MWLSYEKFLNIAAFATQNVRIIYKIEVRLYRSLCSILPRSIKARAILGGKVPVRAHGGLREHTAQY